MQLKYKKQKLAKALTLLTILLPFITGCQTTSAPSMSLEEARKIASDFKISNYVAPPRNIEKYKAIFKNGKAIPDNCRKEWDQWDRNLVNMQDGLKSAKRSSSFFAFGDVLVLMAEGLASTGRYDQAVKVLNNVYRTYPDKRSVKKAQTATQLARLYAKFGDISKAKSQMNIASNWWASSKGEYGGGQPAVQLYENAGLGTIAMVEGKLPLAEYFYRNSMDSLSFKTGVSTNRINRIELRAELASVILMQGRPFEAEAEARAAIDWLKITSPESKEYSGYNADPVIVFAKSLMQQGKIENAEYLARIALNMHESSCSRPQSFGITNSRQVLIDILAEQEKWQEVLNQVHITKASLVDFPEIYLEKFESSLAHLEALLRLGHIQKGLTIAESVQVKLEKSSSDLSPLKGILALGFLQNGELDKAQNTFAQFLDGLSLDLTETHNRTNRILEGYVQLLSQKAQHGDQFAIDELLRVTAIQQSGRVQSAFNAGAARAAANSPELEELVRQEQNLHEEELSLSETLAFMVALPTQNQNANLIGSVRERLRNVQNAKTSLRSEINAQFPEYSALVSPKPLDTGEIQKILRKHQSLLFISIQESETLVWAVPHVGQTAFAQLQMGKTEIKAIIDDLRLAIDPGAIKTIDEIPPYDVKKAFQLYQKILGPVSHNWKDKQELLVITSSPLGSLPLSMLTTSPNKADPEETLFANYRHIDWLLNDIAITYYPSLNSLKPLRIEAAQVQKDTFAFVGFGDPFFNIFQARDHDRNKERTRGISLRNKPETRSINSADLAQLPRLEDTRDEIMSVAQTLGADINRDVFLGKRANETLVKQMDLSRYQIISFATHGLIPGDLNGLDEPALALTSPDVTKNKEDGLLTMNEILTLNLNADFAVLSACNTAAGEGDGAESLSGLGRAFFYAGAKSILVSNWPVYSAATTDLMTQMFAAKVKDPQMTKTQALRQTKLNQITHSGLSKNGKMIYSYAHPIFWAPFTIVGDGGI